MTPEEQEAAYAIWAAIRPEHVRIVAEQFKPWLAYRIKQTGQVATILAFGESEDGTVSLRVSVENFLGPDHEVYGLAPNDLELMS